MQREGNIIAKERVSSLKVSVAMGTADHHMDDSKLSEFSDYKIIYDITKHAESGTGAKPEDDLFPGHEHLTLEQAKKDSSDAVGATGASLKGALKSGTDAVTGAADKAGDALKSAFKI